MSKLFKFEIGQQKFQTPTSEHQNTLCFSPTGESERNKLCIPGIPVIPLKYAQIYDLPVDQAVKIRRTERVVRFKDSLRLSVTVNDSHIFDVNCSKGKQNFAWLAGVAENRCV